MDSMLLYDVASGQWLWQPTKAEKPPNHRDGCAAVARGKNGTYEIFIYGGHPADTGAITGRDDLWVLTMPGFTWFKAGPTLLDNGAGGDRTFTSCIAVNSQLVVVGSVLKANTGKDKDPWSQGIGVFDMTELKWRSSYDPALVNYDSPQAVQEYYRNRSVSSDHQKDRVGISAVEFHGLPDE
ncbi:Rab9 effector protein [Microdochium nivale]|nr:Rab9 effector protein [Microdochium nivale]